MFVAGVAGVVEVCVCWCVALGVLWCGLGELCSVGGLGVL